MPLVVTEPLRQEVPFLNGVDHLAVLTLVVVLGPVPGAARGVPKALVESPRLRVLVANADADHAASMQERLSLRFRDESVAGAATASRGRDEQVADLDGVRKLLPDAVVDWAFPLHQASTDRSRIKRHEVNPPTLVLPSQPMIVPMLAADRQGAAQE